MNTITIAMSIGFLLMVGLSRFLISRKAFYALQKTALENERLKNEERLRKQKEEEWQSDIKF